MSEITDVKFYNLAGAVVKTYKGFGTQEVSLNLDVDGGIYFVAVTTLKGRTINKIVVE